MNLVTLIKQDHYGKVAIIKKLKVNQRKIIGLKVILYISSLHISHLLDSQFLFVHEVY